MQGGILYHFYDGPWYDPAKRRTHDLPCERRTRYRLSQPDTSSYVLDTLTCRCLSNHARCIEKMATCFDLFGSIFSKHALTNRFVSVVGNISQMKDSPSYYVGLHKCIQYVHFRKHTQNRRWALQFFRKWIWNSFLIILNSKFETSRYISKAGMST